MHSTSIRTVSMMVKTFSRQRNGNTRLAPNFLAREFASRCGADNILIDTRLPQVLQTVRNLLGDRPLNVNSGFRTPEHNARSGGSPNSFHIRGQAADISQSGTDLVKICRAVESAFLQHGIAGGICIYPQRRFVHLDLRNFPRWRGQDDSDGRGARNVSGWSPLDNITAHAQQPQSTIVSYQVRINTERLPLNVRADAGTQHRQIGSVARNSIQTVISERQASDGSLWGQIRAPGVINNGWIALAHTVRV